MARESRRGTSDADKLRAQLRGLGTVIEPHEAEEPILSLPVRAAVFGWLTEINARDELAAARLKPRSTGLLFGPPGCGKTTLAHHLAARLGIPLVCIGSENLFESAWGAAERNVARLFDTLRDCDAPCVVFIDEIEAIGGKRDRNTGGSADNARTSTLTVLLRRIEAFDGIGIAATNRPDDLDPALWRRFGMHIDVALPDDDARWAILKRYGEPFAFDDETLDLLTDLTEGAAPSLLRQLMEGVKRGLVLAPKLRSATSSLPAAFAAVVAQTRPHPDYVPPTLWMSPGELDELDGRPWPPPRID